MQKENTNTPLLIFLTIVLVTHSNTMIHTFKITFNLKTENINKNLYTHKQLHGLIKVAISYLAIYLRNLSLSRSVCVCLCL